MKHFTKLNNLPILDLKTEIINLINQKIVNWGIHSQICLNTLPGQEDNFFAGSGSLYYDWIIQITDNGVEKLIPKEIENPKKEEDFTVLCSVFKNTLFEDVYNSLSNKYHLGRVRLMKSKPKTCLTWHVDSTPRIHFPIKTQEGCFMVIDDEVKHLPQETWWYTNTTLYHTAFNSSTEDRIHLVAAILGQK